MPKLNKPNIILKAKDVTVKATLINMKNIIIPKINSTIPLPI